MIYETECGFSGMWKMQRQFNCSNRSRSIVTLKVTLSHSEWNIFILQSLEAERHRRHLDRMYMKQVCKQPGKISMDTRVNVVEHFIHSDFVPFVNPIIFYKQNDPLLPLYYAFLGSTDGPFCKHDCNPVFFQYILKSRCNLNPQLVGCQTSSLLQGKLYPSPRKK